MTVKVNEGRQAPKMTIKAVNTVYAVFILIFWSHNIALSEEQHLNYFLFIEIFFL